MTGSDMGALRMNSPDLTNLAKTTTALWFVSSLHGRGTRRNPRPVQFPPRFIPARAGNTPPVLQPAQPPPVHPRAGGEHPAMSRVPTIRPGSSPRGRGTRLATGLPRDVLRFIPARAGNTLANSALAASGTVHPRVGGEHVGQAVFGSSRNGSSPRGRGTPRLEQRLDELPRFIPAWAGNTERL